VPCFDNEKTLPEVLAALKAQTRPADQYLFVHDRCTDNSAAIGLEHGFEMVEQTGPRGLAAGRNQALQRATGDVLAGIDADVVVEPNYLEELEKKYAANPDVAAIGGRLDERYTDTPADLWRSVHMPQHQGNADQFNPRHLCGATTSCRVSALRQLGGWNEKYVSNYEDVDLSERLKTSGYTLLYTPSCRAWHLRRDTLQSVLKTFWNWNFFGYEDSVTAIDKWLESRQPSIWWRFRLARLDDLRHPNLCPITLMMPWTWVIRDLHVLRSKVGDFGSIGHVTTIAGNILIRLGMKPQGVMAFTKHLDQLASSVEPHQTTREPLRQDIAHQIAVSALESIPDNSYWQICNAGIERSSDFKIS
jgi:GT2 family glycosyltransferase